MTYITAATYLLLSHRSLGEVIYTRKSQCAVGIMTEAVPLIFFVYLLLNTS